MQSVRGTVYCLDTPSLTWELLLPVSVFSKKEKVSCNPADDHHEVEDDDQELEDCHQLQGGRLALAPCHLSKLGMVPP